MTNGEFRMSNAALHGGASLGHATRRTAHRAVAHGQLTRTATAKLRLDRATHTLLSALIAESAC